MFKATEGSFLGWYRVVQETVIAREMTKEAAENIARLLNQQAESKTPTPSDLEKQAAVNRKLDAAPITGWESLRYNGVPIDPVSGKPLLSCNTCHKPIEGKYATIGGNWVPPIAPKSYHLGCVPPLKAAAEEQQAAINRKLDKLTIEAEQLIPGCGCSVCEAICQRLKDWS